MTIESERSGKTVVMVLAGRLDTATAPLLERKLKQWGDDVHEIVLDFMSLTYISSMGLRVLLQAYKTMNAHDRKLVIKNMGESIREVFEMTGFIQLMAQEEKFVVVRKKEEHEHQVTLCLVGEMNPENVALVSEALAQIKEENGKKNIDLKVILDAEKLSGLAEHACGHLQKAIRETGWSRRKLVIQNLTEKLRSVLCRHELDGLLE
jgi:anti-sigma B factor antagonist